MAGSSLWPDAVDNLKENYADGAVAGDTVAADNQNDPNASINAIQDEQIRTYRPDLKPATPSAYDDEFETGLLDPIWTASNCATGTVDMLSVAAAKDTWDATMYASMMALQPGRDNAGAGGMEAEAAILRQTINIADANAKFVAKVDLAATGNAAGTVTAPAPCIGIMLSGINGFNDNNYLYVTMRDVYVPAPMSTVMAVGAHNIAGAGNVQILQPTGIPHPRYLMITKTANNYSAFIGSGTSWAGATDAAAVDNTVFAFGAGVFVRLSVFVYWAPPAAEVNLFNPIGTFDFIRYFANNTPLINA